MFPAVEGSCPASLRRIGQNSFASWPEMSMFHEAPGNHYPLQMPIATAINSMPSVVTACPSLVTAGLSAEVFAPPKVNSMS